MKGFLCLIAFFTLATSCHSQITREPGEFIINTNGLIYAENDMAALRFVVDSLNLRYKTCELNKTYFSRAQGRVRYVQFKSESNDLTEIIKDIKANVGFYTIVAKYESLISLSDTSLLVIRERTGEKEKPFSYSKGRPFNGYSGFYINTSDARIPDIANRWVYDYSPKSVYSKSYDLICHFFLSPLEKKRIPDEYARLIQYVDCMIDTSSIIYLFDTKSAKGYHPIDSQEECYSKINNYINRFLRKTNHGKDDWEYNNLTAEKIRLAIHNLNGNPVFVSFVKDAAEFYLKKNTGDDLVEELIAALISREKALLIKRNRLVIGTCSMDPSPRIHAKNIALLAAETHHWDIFLRAHLDLMNDRFERVTDGSYAFGPRKTYIKELEQLNLNTIDLVLGLTLRADNVAENHYYGTIRRMGRALAESNGKDLFEQKAISMMKDDLLDEFNRGLVFLLYKSYTSYLDDKEFVKKRLVLKDNIASFPVFIQSSIAGLSTSPLQNRDW